MSGEWLYQASKLHMCKTPDLDNVKARRDVNPGDMWGCNECERVHVVKEDQLDRELRFVKLSMARSRTERARIKLEAEQPSDE